MSNSPYAAPCFFRTFERTVNDRRVVALLVIGQGHQFFAHPHLHLRYTPDENGTEGGGLMPFCCYAHAREKFESMTDEEVWDTYARALEDAAKQREEADLVRDFFATLLGRSETRH